MLKQLALPSNTLEDVGLRTMAKYTYAFPGPLQSRHLLSHRSLFQCCIYLLFFVFDIFISDKMGVPSIIDDLETIPIKEALISASLLAPNIFLAALSIQLEYRYWRSWIVIFPSQIVTYLITAGVLLRLASDPDNQYAEIAHFVAFGNSFGTIHALSLVVRKYRTPGSGKRWQWMASFKKIINVRGVGSPECNPDIVHRGPEPAVNGAAFVFKRVLQLYFNWRLLRIRDILVWLASRPCHDRVCLYRSSTYVRRVLTGEVTSAETVARIMLATNAWAYCQMYMTIVHCALSIFFVSLGDRPAEWPDLFGDVSEVINIRTFFTRYWHTLHYRGFVEFGKIASFQLLGLEYGGLAASIVIRCFVFLSSGLIHGWLSWADGETCNVKPEIYQYVLFPLALLTEDLFIRLYQAYFGKVHSPFSVLVFRNLGRIWVFAVMFFVVAEADVMKAACESARRRSRLR
jgi:hypothetical protein